MKNSSKYTVYISSHCSGCKRVVRFLHRENISCKVLNIDIGAIMPPINLLVFPALLNGKQLVAYGDSDIIGALSNGSL